MLPVRRLVVLILLLLVPFQFAWSAVAGVHGHMGADAPAMGVHAHEHGHAHQEPGQVDPASGLANGVDTEHGEDGHHASHYHPVFSSVLMEHSLALTIDSAGGPPLARVTDFLSRVTPPLDRPPLALA